jgi:hypothetical protein
MTRFWRKIIAALGLVALLFAQLVVAAYACPTPADRKAPMAEVVTPAAVQPCQNNMDQERPNLCKQHCEQASQSVDTKVPMAIDAPALPLIAMVVQTDTHLPIKATVQEDLLANVAEPPLSIRNCCLRI